MADGYARASNQPGVIIAGQNGPGATNLVTGLAQAKAAFSPEIIAAFNEPLSCSSPAKNIPGSICVSDGCISY